MPLRADIRERRRIRTGSAFVVPACAAAVPSHGGSCGSLRHVTASSAPFDRHGHRQNDYARHDRQQDGELPASELHSVEDKLREILASDLWAAGVHSRDF
jgi:hypothetical protein